MRKVGTVIVACAIGTAAFVVTAGPAAACHGSTVEIWIDNDTCIGIGKIEIEEGTRR